MAPLGVLLLFNHEKFPQTTEPTTDYPLEDRAPIDRHGQVCEVHDHPAPQQAPRSPPYQADQASQLASPLDMAVA